ncbi:hypothetical protein KAX17_12105 [Candidatus Bipolaricaulota bacterium]|nr:hypothetical protein [Candidatus Bipolaricaulota bacterium]
MFFIVGELINSTRPQIGEALKRKDAAYIQMLARSQAETGVQVWQKHLGERHLSRSSHAKPIRRTG